MNSKLLNNTVKNKTKGFTLIELMITVSIAAILMSIAVPSFKTLFKNNRVTAASNEFVAAMVLAKSEALKRNNNVSLCVSDNQQTCISGGDFGRGWIVFVDCNKDGVIDGSGAACNGQPETIIKVHDPLTSISIIPTGSRQFLTYTFSGRSDTATLEVTEKGKTDVERTIIISRTGRVRTQ